MDGVGNVCDNCPTGANANQADTDTDGEGDVCDSPLVINEFDYTQPNNDDREFIEFSTSPTRPFRSPTSSCSCGTTRVR
ncbi:MAG: thrombospondin type 3 repeat-containing protein [bacterium]